MNRQKIILAAIVLALIGATAGVLARAKANQKLGAPGIKTRPLAGSKNLEILLPENAPGFTSEIATNSETELLKLPPDTSLRVRVYKAPDDFFAQVSVVLMGSDRSSIHRPQICMTGQGWKIDTQQSGIENLHLDRPSPYELPVNKLLATKEFAGPDGRPQTARGIYVYWFVDGTHYTASAEQWMLWWMPRDLLLNGTLERWSYISFFTACNPGQEAATYERLKKLMTTLVPEFQLVPGPAK